MNPLLRRGGFVVLFAVAILFAGCMEQTTAGKTPTSVVPAAAGPQWAHAIVWKDAFVGSPSPAGRHEWSPTGDARHDSRVVYDFVPPGASKYGVLTLTGAGAGLERRGDQCQFAYIDRQAGDVEIIVRLRDFSGDESATAGIMVRGDNWSPDGPMAAVFYRPGDNSVIWLTRLPGENVAETQAGTRIENGVWVSTMVGASPKAAPPLHGSGIGLAKRGPIWLRLVRVGDQFAVFRSRDGKRWSMISNGSGGDMHITGPMRVGVFVSSGAQPVTDTQGPTKPPVTAVFDSIQIGDPHLRYRSSLVGNSGGTGWHNHVSNALPAMWVAPDGTCYTSSYWDEGEQPVSSYRDGKIWRPLPIPVPQTGHGGITGDTRYNNDPRYKLYVATNGTITVLDPEARDFAPRAMTLSVDLLDRKAGNSVVTGMASNGNELFVADSRENVIRVIKVWPEKLYTSALNPEGPIDWTPEGLSGRFVIEPRRPTPTDMAVMAAEPVEVPEGDNFAPAIVYQTQRLGENVTYTFPGLTPGGVYTIRVHLAEFIKRPAHADPKSRIIGLKEDNRDSYAMVNVAERAGGPLKATSTELNATADDKGNLVFTYKAHGGNFSPLFGAIGAGPGVCGIEVLDGDGQRVAAVNCGGPAVDDFKGETEDIRTFPFERPGVMVFDKRGWLWILQREAIDPETKETIAPAVVKAYGTDGRFLNKEITDLVTPNGLAYDLAKDELLIGENIPDLNVRFYGDLANTPKLVRTFGEKGGIYAGKTPGLVYDPEAGGYARFAGINCLGVDKAGNLYVGGGWQGSDLRMFTPDGQLGWRVHSLMFCSTYDFDPAADGTVMHGTYNRLNLDLDKTAAGSEHSYAAYTWDNRRFGPPVRPGNSQAILRRLGQDNGLFMYTSDQGGIGHVYLFRYEGEIAIPCGAIRGDQLWIDANGDGKETPDEVTKMDIPMGHGTLVVDIRGDIWTVGTVGNPEGAVIRRIFFKGLNEHGVPVYSGQKGDYEETRMADEPGEMRLWMTIIRIDYDADRDILVAFFPAETGKSDRNNPPSRHLLARYDNWSKGNRTATWKVPMSSPYYPGEGDAFMYETRMFPWGQYQGMQLVGDYVFLAYLFGEVHAFDLKTGELAEIFSIGPETSGFTAWEDAAMGLRAFKRKNGEYLIVTENSGWGGKNNFFRWTPGTFVTIDK